MADPLNLIEKALQYAKEEREEFEDANLGISEPLTPKAKRSVLYLRIKLNITSGCRKAVRLIDEKWKRSVAFSILMQACTDIFHYKKTDTIVNAYNSLLDDMIGTH